MTTETLRPRSIVVSRVIAGLTTAYCFLRSEKHKGYIYIGLAQFQEAPSVSAKISGVL